MLHGAVPKAIITGIRLPLFCTILLFSVVGDLKSAFAACTVPVGGIVTCSSGNYAAGIYYDPFPGSTLKVETGASIAPAADTEGIYINGNANASVAIGLADGVTIMTDGFAGHGVRAQASGTGNIVINSAADITFTGDLNPPFPPLPNSVDATSGLLGWIRGAAASGNIEINQLADSTINANGFGGGGLYGLQEGSGNVTVTSAGVISTTGESGYGLNAVTGGTGNAIATLTGNVTTSGKYGVGVFSLNQNIGQGNAYTHVLGAITTTGFSSDGAVAQVHRATSIGNAFMDLSNTANIKTHGDESNGAWALNEGLGNATLTSAATVYTEGKKSNGLLARIDDPSSVADASATLKGGGTVTTIGELGHGIFVNNSGVSGTSVVTMAAGSSVTTAGKLANGVYGLSGPLAGNGATGGTVSFALAAEASIAVYGEQAFGVNMNGNQAATAQLQGAVSATGQYGVGAAAFSNSGVANILIDWQSTVNGGWQADVGGLGVDTNRASAGVLIGAGVSSHLTNLGIIGAASDRAIADIGRQAAIAGNLTVANSGLVTGFVQLAGGGINAFENSSLFDVRHFADTDGNGVRDTKRVAISDFGASTSSFNNRSDATVRLAPVLGETSTNATGYYIPTTGIDSRALEASYYALGRSGVVQGQFTNLGTFHNAGVIDLRGSAIGNTLVMTGNAVAGAAAAGSGVYVSDGGLLRLNTVLNEGVAAGGQTGSFSDVLVVDSTRMGTGATMITIDRREDTGAYTPGNGIELVEVRDKQNSAVGVFALNGDFTTKSGEQAVIGGAYAYTLFHGGSPRIRMTAIGICGLISIQSIQLTPRRITTPAFRSMKLIRNTC